MTQANTGLTDIQAGRLLADVEHLREAMAQQGLLLKEISDKLDDSVTRDEFERYKREHIKDVRENYVRRDEIAGIVNFWRLVTSNLAKFFAIALVAVAIYLTAKYVSQQVFLQRTADIQFPKTKEG